MWLFRRNKQQEASDDFDDDEDYDSDGYETDSHDDDDGEHDPDVLDSGEDDDDDDDDDDHKEHTSQRDVQASNDESTKMNEEEPHDSGALPEHDDSSSSNEEEEDGSFTSEEAVGDESSVEQQEISDHVLDETDGDDNTNGHDAEASMYDEEDDGSRASNDEDDEQVTSLEEKQSLLALAVEHDRVDILQAILTEQTEERESLLDDPNQPPLHVAVLFGSTNATTCLLRMGANPAIRPNGTTRKENNPLARYEGVSAWELAFGTNANDDDQRSSSWLGGMLKTSGTPVDMAPSKREGIRHAFTAEALRCIGSDEVDRLKQLLDSGMPSNIDIGGKTLHGWCVELGAKTCEALTCPKKDEGDDEQEEGKSSAEGEEATRNGRGPPDDKPALPAPRAVMRMVSDPDSDSLGNLANRLEELESLARALSMCLDNLAEEVSVCHGLLLLGGGASALASHVRSLKAQKQRRLEELQEWTEKWNDAQDELAYWVKEVGGNFEEIAASKLNAGSRQLSFNLSPETPQEEESQRQQLLAQIGASENRIRKLRASITDLSEENARDLAEVEKRGLSGGIKLVRSLREEIREVEFQLSETKTGEAACRTGVALISSRLGTDKTVAWTDKRDAARPSNGHGTEAASEASIEHDGEGIESHGEETSPGQQSSEDAVVVRDSRPRGYLPIDIWQILLRIIGLGASPSYQRSNNGSSNVIIV